ncbi:nuclear transport factor 2 family protein [Glycomyces sp. NPDC047010]|uniref:nuclear transport factor 2 family protein n=1 Tax=Glycomyces sp. NPDC047010 TaxID=3155023 RepID=UPI0033F72E9C
MRIVSAVGAEGEIAMARRGGEVFTALLAFPPTNGLRATIRFARKLRETMHDDGLTREDSLAAAETELQRALLAGDVVALEALLRPDVVYVAPDGAEFGKSQDLEPHASGQLRLTSLERLQSTARQFGPTGVTRARVRIAGLAVGEPFEAETISTRAPDCSSMAGGK